MFSIYMYMSYFSMIENYIKIVYIYVNIEYFNIIENSLVVKLIVY